MKNIEKLTLESEAEKGQIYSYILHFSKTLKVFNLKNFHHLHLKSLINNCENLEEFSFKHIQHNEWTDFNLEDELLGDIFKLKKLKKLHLRFCNLDSSDEELIRNHCSKWEYLEKVELAYRNISCSCLNCFQQSLENCSNINYIYLKGIDNVISVFLGLLPSCQNLNTLIINRCPLYNLTCERLSLLLKDCSKLKNFELLSVELNQCQLSIILRGLICSSNSLQEISFQNSLTQEHGEDIKHFLSRCTVLEKVDFSENITLFDGIIRICEGLTMSSSQLKSVNFEKCIREEEHLEYIQEMEIKMASTEFCHENHLICSLITRVRRNSFIYSDYYNDDDEYRYEFLYGRDDDSDETIYGDDFEPCYDSDGLEIETYGY